MSKEPKIVYALALTFSHVTFSEEKVIYTRALYKTERAAKDAINEVVKGIIEKSKKHPMFELKECTKSQVVDFTIDFEF